MKNEELRQAAKAIFEAGLQAVDPYQAVKSCIRRDGARITVRSVQGSVPELVLNLNQYKKIAIVGAGKATARMCLALEETLGNQVKEGLIVVKHGYLANLKRVRIVEASHPIPDQAGVQGVDEMLRLVDALDESALLFTLISGGGSALLPAPAGAIQLQDKQKLTELLLRASADIQEVNIVRKHLSLVKGGGLAKRAFPATVVSLILSDVVGDCLEAIASGPTVADSTTYADAKKVLQKYKLWAETPRAIQEHLQRGIDGEIPETPKPTDEVFRSCHNILVGTNFSCLRACQEYAQKIGFNTLLLSSRVRGETKDVARMHATIALEIQRSGNPVRPPACIISGGETTVQIQGDGLGGRNQEFALAAALEIQEEKGVAIFSAGTDGTDGPTDAAGAISFGDTLQRACTLGLDATGYLGRNDSYHFFEALGDLIQTGPTNTNVMDVHLVLVSAP